MIVGGWEYVWAAYVIVWTGLGLYSWSVVSRRRAATRTTTLAAREGKAA